MVWFEDINRVIKYFQKKVNLRIEKSNFSVVESLCWLKWFFEKYLTRDKSEGSSETREVGRSKKFLVLRLFNPFSKMLLGLALVAYQTIASTIDKRETENFKLTIIHTNDVHAHFVESDRRLLLILLLTRFSNSLICSTLTISI